MPEKEIKPFKKQVLASFSKLYGISGAEKLLLGSVIDKVEGQVMERTGHGLDFVDIIDVALELETFGFDSIAEDNHKTLLKYGEQLVWEGERFNNPARKRSGEEIIRRLTLGY
jgi:hypothetical protein